MRSCLNLHGVVPQIVGTYAELPRFVADLEAEGIDQVAFGDMLLLEPGLGHGGSFSFDAAAGFLEPLTALAAAAGTTSTIRLSTGILVAPTRHPVLLAKAAATVDVISGGRLDLVLASGWAQALFDAVGVPFEERFARLEEAVQVCRAIWGAEPASFDGQWTSFGPMHGGPQPVQGRLPLWLGAQVTTRAARRAATHFDGWALNSTTDPATVSRALELLAEECAVIGRDPAELTMRATAMASARQGRADPPPIGAVLNELTTSLDELDRRGVDVATVLLGTVAADRADAEAVVATLTHRRNT